MELIEAASAEFERVVPARRGLVGPADAAGDLGARLDRARGGGNRLTAMLLAGVDRDEARSSLASDQLGDDPIAAVLDSARQQREGFAKTAPRQTVAGPKGDIPAAAFLGFRLVDLVVHAWDLLRAARPDESLDPRVVDGLVELVEHHLGEMLAFGAYGEGPSDTLPPDASPQSRLLDWFGRRP